MASSWVTYPDVRTGQNGKYYADAYKCPGNIGKNACQGLQIKYFLKITLDIINFDLL